MALDHIVLAADSLGEGIAYLRDRIGCDPSPGGRHPTMGTHNAVLRLGEAVYLEVIAADPEAADPERPRWMGLDDPLTREALKRSPRLVCWMATSDHIEAASARFGHLVGSVWQGERGNLRWQLTVREDGALPACGALPSLIQWPAGVHPAPNMPDLGFRFRALTVRHRAKTWLDATLDALGAGGIAATAERREGEPVLELMIEKDGRAITL